LLWKEWREHRWRMAALAAIYIGAAVVSSINDVGDFYVAAVVAAALGIPMSGLFLGMHEAAGEQGAGTIKFLQSLPIDMRRPAAAKLIWGAMTVTIPILVIALLATLWGYLPGAPADFRRELHWPLAWGLAGSLGAISVLIWAAAAGVNRSDEVRAGAVALLAMLGYFMLFGTAYYLMGERNPNSSVNQLAVWLGPSGPVSGLFASARTSGHGPLSNSGDWAPDVWRFMLATAITHAGLAAWYLLRFGRVAPPTAEVGRTAERPLSNFRARAWLAPPRRSPLTALLWKQIRESAPLALMGAATIIAMGIWWVATSRNDVGSFSWRLILALMAMGGTIGFFVAVVAGIGTFMEDMRPGVYDFWRSHPVSVNRWFWLKLITGAVVTISIVQFPSLAAAMALAARAPDFMSRDFVINVCLAMLVQFGGYLAAALMMILVRQAIYAAILAMGALVGVAALVSRFDDTTPWPWAIIATAMIGGALLAWIAARKDWGWKW
jgi:ABC-type transport system involved in multi-copper enzyme maturation permease subunit